jgi:osmotically inducible lipoprotein OsmB
LTMRLRTALAAAAATTLLAACGTDPTDRAISGAALGAGAGALVDEPLAGAGVGAAVGALTDPGTINLGRPPWR